jgi:post-segregation antitoxin (ccd killing protein)
MKNGARATQIQVSNATKFLLSFVKTWNMDKKTNLNAETRRRRGKMWRCENVKM